MDKHDRLATLMALRYAQANVDDLVESFQNNLDGDDEVGLCRIKVGEETVGLLTPTAKQFLRLAKRMEGKLGKPAPDRFAIPEVHKDWYADGVDGDEECWRMDLTSAGNEFQIQLFATVEARVELARLYRPGACYMFVERDNRFVTERHSYRVDYAGQSYPMSDRGVIGLLALSEPSVLAAVRQHLDEVARLPNNQELILRNLTPAQKDVVRAYWAGVSRSGTSGAGA